MIIIALAQAVYLAPGSSVRLRERKGITGLPNSLRISENSCPMPLLSRAISHARGHLRVSRFARRTRVPNRVVFYFLGVGFAISSWILVTIQSYDSQVCFP